LCLAITGVFALFFDANVQANGNTSQRLTCRGQEFIVARAAVVTGICVSVGCFLASHLCDYGRNSYVNRMWLWT